MNEHPLSRRAFGLRVVELGLAGSALSSPGLAWADDSHAPTRSRGGRSTRDAAQAGDHPGFRPAAPRLAGPGQAGRHQPQRIAANRDTASDLPAGEGRAGTGGRARLRRVLGTVPPGTEGQTAQPHTRLRRVHRRPGEDQRDLEALRPGTGTQPALAAGDRGGLREGDRRVGPVGPVPRGPSRPAHGPLQRLALAAAPLDEQQGHDRAGPDWHPGLCVSRAAGRAKPVLPRRPVADRPAGASADDRRGRGRGDGPRSPPLVDRARRR